MSTVTQLSPGVVTREVDLTNIMPSVGMSGGAFVGQFIWGPVLQYTIVNSANELAKIFGKPTETNYVDWYTASNFLSYAGNLNVVRVVDESTALNATADGLGLLIKNEEHYHILAGTNQSALFAARYPGALGNSLKVSIADSATFNDWEYKDQFDFAPSTSEFAAALGASNDEVHVVVVDEDGLFTGVPGAILEKYAFLSKASDAKQLDGSPAFYGNVINNQSKYVYYLGVPTTMLVQNRSVASVNVSNGGSGYTTATVKFSDPPAGGVTATGSAVIKNGAIVDITILEPGSGYTTEPTVTITGDGTGAVATAVLGPDNTIDNWAQPALTESGRPRAFASLNMKFSMSLSGGSNGGAVTSNELIAGWDMFGNAEEVDVSLLIMGAAGGPGSSTAVIQHVIDNVVDVRKDCIVFFSPDLQDVLNKTQDDASKNVIAKRNKISRDTSYAVMDSGWKLQYDVFADKYRWIPLNGDIAGLCASTDQNYDPWWSPAGFNRGKIKNVVSLAFNPNKNSRDALYKNSINPVVTFTGDGTILYGDKTLQAKASAFSFINIRRLFIVLEKSISRAAKQQLFEFNDQFTRAQFKNMIEPFLREVKGRRGIYDFSVVCDETNNTGDVIDRGEFVASIFIKPARSINFITLNFVAVRTGVEFNEVVGTV
jgi:phage tail sheath protein FI